MEKELDKTKMLRIRDVFTKENLPRCALSLALMLAVQFTVYLVPTIFTKYLTLHDITLPMDAYVPFAPVFLIPYIGVFAEWGWCYMFAPLLSRERFGRFLAAMLLGFIGIFACYMLFPTTYTRPELTGEGVFFRLLEYIYGVDEPSRCLPSMHCFLGWMCWRLVHGEERVPGYIKTTLFALGVITLPTTLLVRQHVFLDVPTGVAMAELCWFIAPRTRLPQWLSGGFERLYGRIFTSK